MADDETTEGPDGADEATAVPEPETRHGALLTWSHGQAVLHTTVEQYRSVVEALHDEGFLVCIDLTVVDYLAHPVRTTLPSGIDPERFEVVVNLLSHAQRERIRLRVQV